jgi:uncharacterized protein YbjT (DUF2867 family)
MADANGTVLVTGGTGFLGGWCVAELLNRGHEVRTTVRDTKREQAVRDARRLAIPARATEGPGRADRAGA